MVLVAQHHRLELARPYPYPYPYPCPYRGSSGSVLGADHHLEAVGQRSVAIHLPGVAFVPGVGLAAVWVLRLLRSDPWPVQGHDHLYSRLDVSSCLLYTSPSPRDRTRSRMPSSA